MKILVIGAGGREHALVKALKRSASCGALWCSPGNDGIAEDTPCVVLEDHAAIVGWSQQQAIDLVVIGPEQPLVDGLADRLRAADIAVFGPSAAAAQIEASKDFTKKLCDKMHIPTAQYATFDRAEDALAYLSQKGVPIVVKADGLAAGKGVTIANDMATAKAAITACFDGQFGVSGARVVLEELLEGEEISLFALSDGTRAIPFAYAQDHKRVGEGDTGPNTGGMGAYCPTPVFSDTLQLLAMEQCVMPAIDGLAAAGTPYVGVLFAGLMLTKDGPKLIEYNARFGDPETQAMLARFDGDLAALLHGCALGRMDASLCRFTQQHAMVVVMAAKGYPNTYEKGTPIQGLEDAAAIEGVKILHAGTRNHEGQWQAHGGRVLNIVALGDTLADAQKRAYQAIHAIDWPEGFYRNDIGWRALR
jgi:phosphoribosylamine--glycine ligase